jgi:hypothetical protein
VQPSYGTHFLAVDRQDQHCVICFLNIGSQTEKPDKEDAVPRLTSRVVDVSIAETTQREKSIVQPGLDTDPLTTKPKQRRHFWKLVRVIHKQRRFPGWCRVRFVWRIAESTWAFLVLD